ncbi:MAG: hypothetical protein ACOC78_01300 [Actinomycetota bacterium]
MRPSGGNTHLAETAVFLAALEEFDFENADFLDDSLMGISLSREAASRVREGPGELEDIDYSGELEHLGVCVREYRQAMEAAIMELEKVFNGLEPLLLADRTGFGRRGGPDSAGGSTERPGVVDEVG